MLCTIYSMHYPLYNVYCALCSVQCVVCTMLCTMYSVHYALYNECIVCTMLCRVQKNAFRNILQERYISYKNALNVLKMETLHDRREKLMLKFGLKCTHLKETKELFTLKKASHNMKTRHPEKYNVFNAKTERMRSSTVPYIQRMLNEHEQKKKAASNSR